MVEIRNDSILPGAVHMQGTWVQGAEEMPAGTRCDTAYIGMNTAILADMGQNNPMAHVYDIVKVPSVPSKIPFFIAGRRNLADHKKYKDPIGAFLRAEDCSRRCRYFEFVAAKRHLNPKWPANGELRPAFN